MCVKGAISFVAGYIVQHGIKGVYTHNYSYQNYNFNSLKDHGRIKIDKQSSWL
ncbi:hypothetical protein [Clostridium tetani]|uniref:hypothetical protein n=1 Tax=Clostridium tetani TaxID=1513 RepID=UPI0013E8FB82|nr:hypothetical protein [Clostridium tetani]